MEMISSQGGHSADVNISLLFNSESIPVAQIGPGFLMLNTPVEHPPGEGSVILRVDQSERRWNVYLPDGISSTSKKVTTTASVNAALVSHH
jgi:hypothetical protein